MTTTRPQGATGAETYSGGPDGVLIARLARRALTELECHVALHEAVTLICDRLGADASMVLELVATGEGFQMLAGTGWITGSPREVVVPRLPGSQVEYVSRQGDVVVIQNLEKETRFTPMPFLLENGIKSSMSAPLRLVGGVTALVSAHSRTQRSFAEEEAAFLRSVADIIIAVLEKRDTEAALTSSEERLRLAMAAGGMGAWEWRIASGKVIWSEELERIHGLAPGTFGGDFEAYQSDMHPDDRKRVLDTIQHSIETGSHSLEYRIVRPDGEVRWLTARGQVLTGADGKPARMVGVCTDITEAKLAAEEREKLLADVQSAEARYTSIFNGVGDTILITNSRGEYVDVNPAAEMLTGFSPAELTAMHISDVVEAGLQWTETEFRRFTEEGRWNGELLLRHKDGRTIDVEAHATAMISGNEPLFVAAIRDVSERKRTAETLARSARQGAAVADLGMRALTATSIQQLMDDAVASITSILGVEYAKVLELLPDGESLFLRSGVGWHEGLVGRATVGAGADSQAGFTLTAGEPVVVADLLTESRFSGPPLLHDHNVTSGMSVILRLPNRIYGVLGAHTTERRDFAEDEVNFLQSVANILSAAVERDENSQELRRLVFQLELERQRVDNLVANVPGVVWEAYGQPDDSAQRIDFVSDHVEEMLSYTVEEWLATPNFWLTIVHPDDRERAAAEAAQIYASGEPGRSEFRWLAKDARIVWVEAHSTVISDAEGNPVGMRGVTMDITARRQADNRLREYAWTLETINRINLSLSRELNLEHIVQQVTDAATSFTSAELGWFVYTLSEQGNVYSQYATTGDEGTWADPDDVEGVHDFLSLLRREGVMRCEDARTDERCVDSLTYLNVAARRTVGAVIAVPVQTRAGGVLGGLVLAHSTIGTFNERAEQLATALAAQATIAIDNALQFRESQRLLEELKLANESKDEFLGLVSHELRTPITTIFGGARLLRSRGDKLDEGSRHDVLEDIERESDRLHRIVEDLLVLARLELGESITTEPVLLRRLAERIIWSFSKTRAGRPLELQTSPELMPVQASAVYMEQVLRNLITNADKYSPPGKPIDLWIHRQGDEAILSVMDRGPGISDEEKSLIFERFYRSSGTASHASGAGIGLTVCKRLMDAQGGRIWAEDREGGGLTVSVALPIYVDANEAS